MNKEKTTEPQKPETPQAEAAAPNTLFHIELEMELETSRLVMKSKAPTVVLCGILRKAEQTGPITIAEKGKERHIYIDYDMATDQAIVRSDASDVIMRGMFQMAYSMITQSQVLQRFQASQAAAKIIKPASAAGIQRLT